MSAAVVASTIVAVVWAGCIVAVVFMGWRTVKLQDQIETKLDLARRAIDAAERPPQWPAPDFTTTDEWERTASDSRAITVDDFPAADRAELIEAAAGEAFRRKLRGFGLCD